jgi:hypothetical protein
MKKLIIHIILISIASCGTSYCDECVETEHTVSSPTGLDNLSIISANIVSEYNTYYKVLIEHDQAQWDSASIIMIKDETVLTDINQSINIETTDYMNMYFTYLTIPISDINYKGEFPTGRVSFEGILSSSDHNVLFTGSTHFYNCESIIDDFKADDCRFSCQIVPDGFGEYSCSSQLCPI